MVRLTLGTIVVALAAGCSEPGPSDAPRFRIVHVVRSPAHAVTAPLGMAAGGTIAGYVGREPFGPLSRAMVIGPSGDLTIVGTTGVTSFGWQATDDGLVAGESAGQATVWVAGVERHLPQLGGTFSGSVHAITSGGGAGSCGDSDAAGPRHCLWQALDQPPQVLEPIQPSAPPIGAVWGVSDGRMVGSTGGLTGFTAVRWDRADGMPRVVGQFEGAVNSEGRGINRLGDVVGRVGFPGDHVRAFVYWEAARSGVLLPELSPAGSYSEALAINANGWIVGTASAGDGTVRGVLWSRSSVWDLNALLSGPVPDDIVRLTAAVGVSESGTIAAAAMMADGGVAVVRLAPVP